MGLAWIQSFALLTMSVQVKLGVGFVSAQTTHKFWRNGISSFLMHSLLVSPQIASCCGIINALSLSGFDVIIKTFFFRMCCLNLVCQFCFATECFVTEIAGRPHFCVDSLIVVIQCVFSHELLSTHIANKITDHFDGTRPWPAFGRRA